LYSHYFYEKDSGFGAEDEYNIFNKPLFDRDGVTSSSIYRPTRGEATLDADEQYDKLMKGATSKFIPDKGFAGAEGSRGTGSNGPRNAPVQFERSSK
jgi:SNW domain-containing protein 1